MWHCLASRQDTGQPARDARCCGQRSHLVWLVSRFSPGPHVVCEWGHRFRGESAVASFMDNSKSLTNFPTSIFKDIGLVHQSKQDLLGWEWELGCFLAKGHALKWGCCCRASRGGRRGLSLHMGCCVSDGTRTSFSFHTATSCRQGLHSTELPLSQAKHDTTFLNIKH